MSKGGNKSGAAKGKPPKLSKARTGETFQKSNFKDLESDTIKKDLQQQCLDIFRKSLKPSRNDIEILQEVKGHLYNREFSKAFSTDEYLRVYASRWSPSRALAYLDIFEDLLNNTLPQTNDLSTFKVVCLGGGAGGELVALAAWLHALNRGGSFRKIHVTLVDIADWTDVICSLKDGITNPPELSTYASQAHRDANKALLEPDAIAVDFVQLDILDSSRNLVPDLLAQANLVTSMFTLNELYSTSMSKTQNLLSHTLNIMQPEAHVLVVDSPGSYSTITLNGTEKEYPMQWLLKYTLLGGSNKTKSEHTPKWDEIMSRDSRWFRLPDGLQYPIELENMRSQMHMFKRASDSGG